MKTVNKMLGLGLLSLSMVLLSTNSIVKADDSGIQQSSIEQLQNDWGSLIARYVPNDNPRYTKYTNSNQFIQANTQNGSYNFVVPNANLSNYGYVTILSMDSQTVSPIPNSQSISYGNSLMGSTSLTNDLDEPQTMSATSTEFTRTYDTSVSTDREIDTGLSVSTPVSDVFGGATYTLDYKWSTNKTQSESTAYSVTVPSQNVTVKPHHTVEVDYMVEEGSGTSKSNMEINLSGKTSTNYLGTGNDFNVPTGIRPAAEVVNQYTTTPSSPIGNWSYYTDGDQLMYHGATLSMTVGFFSKTNIVIKDITDGTTQTIDLGNNYEVHKL